MSFKNEFLMFRDFISAGAMLLWKKEKSTISTQILNIKQFPSACVLLISKAFNPSYTPYLSNLDTGLNRPGSNRHLRMVW